MDAQGSLVFKSCLVAAVIANLEHQIYDRSVIQVCHAFHASWTDCPPGLELEFVPLVQGWHSPDVQLALYQLWEHGIVTLFDDRDRRGRLMIEPSIIRLAERCKEHFPALEENIAWIMEVGYRVGAELDTMNDPYSDG